MVRRWAFREDCRSYLDEYSDPIVDEGDQEPLTREEFLGYAGEGLETENRLERHYRDVGVMTIPDGTTEIQKRIVGTEITGRSAY